MVCTQILISISGAALFFFEESILFFSHTIKRLILFLFVSILSSPVSPLQKGSVEEKPGLTEEEVRFEAACQQLASEAVRRGCADNVTVILVSVGF